MIVKAPPFGGCCADLKGYVFDLSNIQNPTKFAKNLRKDTKYVGREFTQGSNIRRSLKGKRILTLPIQKDMEKN